VGTGGIAVPEADLLIGGSIANNLAALVVASGFGSDGLVTLESAWGRASNIAGTSWFNVRAGKLELDLPASEHRTLTLTAPYAFYHYHPAGSSNLFEMGNNQLGVEVMGHPDNRVGFRYSVAFVNANDNPGSASVWSSPVAYAHVTETFHPMPQGITRARIGAFGYLGFWPTSFDTLTPPTTPGAPPPEPAPVPGTGTDHKPFASVGTEVGLTIGPLARPLSVQVVGVFGTEDKQLIANGTRNATFVGGFVEVAYSPLLYTTIFSRYDRIQSLQGGDETQPDDLGNTHQVALGGRWALLQSRSAAMNLHLEGSWFTTHALDADNNVVDLHQLIFATGVDLAL